MKIETKKNEEIKGRISSGSLIPLYTVHLLIVHLCTKFHLLSLTVPEKSVTEN